MARNAAGIASLRRTGRCPVRGSPRTRTAGWYQPNWVSRPAQRLLAQRPFGELENATNSWTYHSNGCLDLRPEYLVLSFWPADLQTSLSAIPIVTGERHAAFPKKRFGQQSVIKVHAS